MKGKNHFQESEVCHWVTGAIMKVSKCGRVAGVGSNVCGSRSNEEKRLHTRKTVNDTGYGVKMAR